MLDQNSNIYRANSFSHSDFFLSLLLILSSCILHSPVERPINSKYKWIVTLIVQKEAAAHLYDNTEIVHTIIVAGKDGKAEQKPVFVVSSVQQKTQNSAKHLEPTCKMLVWM